MKYLAYVVRNKELLLLVFLSSLFLGYLGIYLFVDEQFDATATIVPRGSEDLTNYGALLKGVKGLPMGLGSSSMESETDLYTTILSSRTLLERVVFAFDLLTEYEIDTTEFAFMEEAIKELRENITTKETSEGAYLVTVRAKSRQQAADMTNFLVREMNDLIIALKVSRSRENRIFLENRVKDVRQQLASSEDSLRSYQERTGMLNAKEQLEGILTVHTRLESELTARELQKAILERQFDRNSPQVLEVNLQIQEYRKELSKLRSSGSPGGPLLALDKLPETAVGFLRWYREIEINHLLMEFIIPLYEQAKLEEKKDYPVLQIIDHAQPPRKRSWPPRVLLAGLGAFSITVLVSLFLHGREQSGPNGDPELRRLIGTLTTWSWRKEKFFE